MRSAPLRRAIAAAFAVLALAGAATLAAQQPSSHASTPPQARTATARPSRVATFDSGFGGYFTAKEIEKQAKALSADGYGPFEIAHYGDTTNIPYGEKTPDQVAAFASAGILAAFRDGAEDVYVACNTASTQIDRIREILRTENPTFPNHVYSVIDISVREVMRTVSSKLKTQDVVVIGLLATPATVKSETYPKFLAKALGAALSPGQLRTLTQPRWLSAKGPTIDSFAYVAEIALGPRKKVVVYQLAPANWVEMIENGAPEAQKRAAVARDLAMLTGETRAGDRFDVVGEFCTHYPVFDAMIQAELKALGKAAPDAPFVVQGPLMGRLFLAEFLQRKPAKAARAVPPPGSPPFYMSGTNLEPTRALVRTIFPNDPEPVIAHKDFVIRR